MNSRRSTLSAWLLGVAFVAIVARGSRADDAPPELADVAPLIAAKRYEEAVRSLERIRAGRPTSGEVHRMLAQAYGELGNDEKARASLVDALAWGRLDASVLAALARIDHDAGRAEAAGAALRLATALKPDRAAWWIALGDLSATSGEDERAEAAYRTALSLEPARADVHMRLHALFVRRDAWDEAATHLETAWHLGERDGAIALRLGDAWRRLGDADAAVRWTELALETLDPTPESSLLHADLLVATGEASRAEAALGPLVEHGTEAVRVHALLQRGSLRMKAGREDDAVRDWQRAADLDGGEPAIRYLGAVHLRAGRHAEAADWLARRVARGEEEADLLRWLAIAWMETNERDAARSVLRRYIEVHGLDETAASLIDRFARTAPR